MESIYKRFDRTKVKFQSVKKRKNKLKVEDIAVKPSKCVKGDIDVTECAKSILEAKEKGAARILCMGAHPIKCGVQLIINELIEKEYLTHVSINGAASIHDFEFAKFGESTECVRTNIANGTFGIWRETGEFFSQALDAAQYWNAGFGEMCGKLINGFNSNEIGIDAPRFVYPKYYKDYKWQKYSVQGTCVARGTPITIHPSIGQDIYYSHPHVDSNVGQAIIDFEIFTESVRNLQNGVYISACSQVMSPQILEKALSMARNVEMQEGRKIDKFNIFINDIAKSTWDWSKGEPPMDSHDYYLRFFKSFFRMGVDVTYYNTKTSVFFQNLYLALE